MGKLTGGEDGESDGEAHCDDCCFFGGVLLKRVFRRRRGEVNESRVSGWGTFRKARGPTLIYVCCLGATCRINLEIRKRVRPAGRLVQAGLTGLST